MLRTSTECSLSALQALSGDALRVYLSLKFFVENGGDAVLSPDKIANTLSMDNDSVRVEMIRLSLKGYLIIRLKQVSDYFDDEKLLGCDWLINPNMHSIETVTQLTHWQHLADDICHLNGKEFANLLKGNRVINELPLEQSWLNQLKNEVNGINYQSIGNF